jgi:hypothetical protein
MITRRWMLGSAAAACAGVALNAKLKADGSQGDNIVFLTSDDGPGAGADYHRIA